MIARITAIFGVSVDKSAMVSIIAAVLGTTGATTAGRSLATNLLKFVPGAGTMVGGAIWWNCCCNYLCLSEAYIEVLSFLLASENLVNLLI